MTAQRSMFTEAIEDHLALKKQNAHLHDAMPLARFDVGDPLDRYPGGPVNPVVGVGAAVAGAGVMVVDPVTAPAMTEPLPFEPLNGMTPMLSLVEDIDENDVFATTAPAIEQNEASIVRFPGGVGPRETEPAQSYGNAAEAMDISFDDVEPAPAAEQPIIVIDTEEPLAPVTQGAPLEPARIRAPRKGGLLSGFRRKKNNDDDDNGAGWFAGNPREFSWDD